MPLLLAANLRTFHASLPRSRLDRAAQRAGPSAHRRRGGSAAPRRAHDPAEEDREEHEGDEASYEGPEHARKHTRRPGCAGRWCVPAAPDARPWRLPVHAERSPGILKRSVHRPSRTTRAPPVRRGRMPSGRALERMRSQHGCTALSGAAQPVRRPMGRPTRPAGGAPDGRRIEAGSAGATRRGARAGTWHRDRSRRLHTEGSGERSSLRSAASLLQSGCFPCATPSRS